VFRKARPPITPQQLPDINCALVVHSNLWGLPRSALRRSSGKKKNSAAATKPAHLGIVRLLSFEEEATTLKGEEDEEADEEEAIQGRQEEGPHLLDEAPAGGGVRAHNGLAPPERRARPRRARTSDRQTTRELEGRRSDPVPARR
ncbi:unnamed protein product, partial [Prorocentrum cordatum]